MRKTWFWLFIFLLTLRLWAGALMPIEMQTMLDRPAQASNFAATHASHGSHSHHGHGHGLSPAEINGSTPLADPPAAHATAAQDCHDGDGGLCTACAVCHLSASLSCNPVLPGQNATHSPPSAQVLPLYGSSWPPQPPPPNA